MKVTTAPQSSKPTESSADELRDLMEDLISCPDKINELSEEQLLELRKYMNPYGDIIESSRSYANLSIINWRDEWFKNFYITALNGYLYRLADEYEAPELELIEEKYSKLIKEEGKKLLDDYMVTNTNAPLVPKKKPYVDVTASNLNLAKSRQASAIKALETARDAEIAEYKKISRSVAKKFLDKNFKFNVDRHVRPAHSKSDTDPERNSLSISQASMDRIRKSLPKANIAEDKIRGNPEGVFRYLKSNLLGGYQSMIASRDVLASSIEAIANPNIDVEDKLAILNKHLHNYDQKILDMKKLAEPLADAETLPSVEIIPPHDVFYHFSRYITNHYEQLREVTAAVFNVSPILIFRNLL